MVTATITYDESGNIVDDLLEPAREERSKSKKEELDIISLKEFDKAIPDEEAAVAFAEEQIWGDTPVCGHCGSENVYRVRSGKPLSHRCRDCRGYFSIRHNTPMYEGNLPILTWLKAIHIMHTSRKGVSSRQLSTMLGVCYESAWFLTHRIRKAMEQDDMFVSGVVQVNEAWFGGKEGNKHADKKIKSGNWQDGKVPVMGFRDDSGRYVAFPIPDTTRSTLEGAIVSNVEPGSTVYTDGHPGYAHISRFGYAHSWVNHSVREFVRGMVTTNGIESFWALLKRGYVGTFHYISAKHLFRYVGEFAFRLNSGKGNGLKTIGAVLANMVGKKLKYQTLIA